MDLRKSSYATTLVRTMRDVKTIGAKYGAHMEPLVKRLVATKGAGAHRKELLKVAGAYGRDASKILILGKQEAFENVAALVQKDIGRELSLQTLDKVKTILGADAKYGSLTTAMRAQMAVRKSVSAMGLDIAAGKYHNLTERFTGSVNYGATLTGQFRRLAIGEMNRYAQRAAMMMLYEAGFRKFGWALSTKHFELMKLYGITNEVCERRAKRKVYSFKQLWNAMPPHPCCMCSPVGLE